MIFKTFFQAAIRNLQKRKAYLFINVFGFSLGVCIALLMFAYVWDEIGYDSYHVDKERIYRVALTRHFPDRENSYATTPPPLGPTIAEEFPEVENYTRVFDLNQTRVQIEDQVFFEDRAFAADSTFFQIFSIPLIEGSKDALSRPNSVVITQSINRKYFGDESGLNQTIEIEGMANYVITGICEDVPKKSHLKFDMLLSLESFSVSNSTFWGSYSLHNYIKLRDPSKVEDVNEKLKDFLEPHFGPQVESILGKTYQEYVAAGNIHDFFLQPIQSIHLNSRLSREFEPNGDVRYVLLFFIVAILILVIASFNFTNLSTAYSVNRSKEIGVRKVLGSSKRQLKIQFLTESTFISFLSVFISFIVALLLLPSFNQLAGKQLHILDFNLFWLFIFLVSLALLVGVFSGLYPATFMSSLSIIKIFKRGIKISNKKFGLRNILVTFQFCASIFMILATIFIVRQLDFMRNQKLGFQKDNIVLLQVSETMDSRYQSLLDRLENQPEILSVTSSFHVPGRQSGGGTFQAIGNSATERFLFNLFVTGYNFHSTYDMELLEGRYFDENLALDSASVIINAECARMIGWSPDEAIGREILITGQESPHKIVGVLKDFHFTSLHEPIGPMVFMGISRKNLNMVQPPIVSIRYQPNTSIERSLRNLEKVWSDYDPNEPVRYTFLDHEFNDLYENEIQFASLFKIFSILAIAISCYGIIGISFFIAVERIQEIGIRKVLGASNNEIILLLSKDFMLLSLFANLITWPVSYFLIKEWMKNYAYAVGVDISYFLLTGAFFTLLMLLVMSSITYRAANSNPADVIGRE